MTSRSSLSGRRFAVALAGIALAMSLAPSAAPAQAAPVAPSAPGTSVTSVVPLAVKKPKLTAAQKTKLRASWTRYKVSKATQKKLIKKLESGKVWNSLKKSKVKSTKSFTKGNYRIKVYRFADGSVRATEKQIAKKQVNTNSVGIAATTSCEYAKSAYSYTAKHCKVTDNYILFGLFMTVDYGSVNTGKGAQLGISRAYDGGGWHVMGSSSWAAPERIEDQEFHMIQQYSIASFFSASQILVVKMVNATDLSVTTKV